MIVGDAITPEQEAEIKASHVVHVSLDPSVPVANPQQAAEDEEGGGEEADPENDSDRVIKNARRARAEDGLFEPQELRELFGQLPTLRSVYDEWGSIDEKRTFGARVNVPAGRRGRSEPMYTSYTLLHPKV